MYQLKNLLNRTAVPIDPGDNMKAAENFLLVVLHSHVIAAADAILSGAQATNVETLAKSIVDRYVCITVPSPSAVQPHADDEVCSYAKELLMLGLLWLNFYDSVKEGDGDRIVRMWKLNLLIFKSAKRKNYSIEALNLILQVDHILSPREAAQVKWSRTVNTTSCPGNNMPMGLHLEHLNRRLKTALRNMGSNISTNSVTSAAKSIHVVNHVCNVFEKSTGHMPDSGLHSSPSFERDYNLVLKVLKENEVFTFKTTKRLHNAFKSHQNIFYQLNYKGLLQWIKRTAITLVKK